jgi:aminopeptidase N
MARQSLLMVLYENYLAKHISADDWVNSLITGLPAEKNALVASTASGYLANVMWEIAPANRAEVEARIYTMTQNHPLPSCRIQLMRLFMQNAISEPMVKKLYILWQQQSDKHLNRQDYTTLAYELAIRMPLESEQILRTQRARIDDPDRLRQFDFISRAAVSDTARLDTLFNSLLAAENRRIEPWTTAVIRYLNHPLREDQSVKYIRPGLEVLEEVQRTGDIFFPKNWAAALLGNHLSSSAYEEVVRFLNERPDYSPLLKNKILQAAYPLYRANN